MNYERKLLSPKERWERLEDPIEFAARKIKKIRKNLLFDNWILNKFIFLTDEKKPSKMQHGKELDR